MCHFGAAHAPGLAVRRSCRAALPTCGGPRHWSGSWGGPRRCLGLSDARLVWLAMERSTADTDSSAKQ
eukprot:scaffold82865_cov68-Phaeocystis_antarctica.AAC.1